VLVIVIAPPLCRLPITGPIASLTQAQYIRENAAVS
jgi:hypothetical protein